MANNFQQKTQSELPKFNELNKFRMFTPAPGTEGRRSQLYWVERDGNPRICVYPNVPSDTAKAPIAAAMNPETFEIFINEFERICRQDRSDKVKIECFQSAKDEQGKATSEKVLASELWFGKDDDGVIWICVTSKDRPKIRFDFLISEYHRIFINGQSVDKPTSSRLQALAVAGCLRRIYTDFFKGIKPPYQKNAVRETPNAPKPEPSGSTTDFDDISF